MNMIASLEGTVRMVAFMMGLLPVMFAVCALHFPKIRARLDEISHELKRIADALERKGTDAKNRTA